MSPTAAAGESLRSASSITPDIARGYHILKIDGYTLTKATPTGEYLKSHPFSLGGHRWHIRYYPNGHTPEKAGYISLFLGPDSETVTKLVNARYRFRFIDEVEEKPLTLQAMDILFLNSGCKFVKMSDFEKSEHLKNDSVRCDLVVINEFRTVEEKADQVATPAVISVPPSNLHQQLGDLLLTEKGADVVFEVGGETFAAHRCVLAARSPVFSAELLGTMKESHTAGVVPIADMEAQVFKALLHFVYTDTMMETEKTEEDVMSQHLLVAADRYNLERLKLMCEEKLCRYIDVGTVATILTLAEQHHCSGLKKVCFRFLRSLANLRAVMSSDGFKHLSSTCPAVIEELLGMIGT